jgi:hypothetical protein
MSWLLQQFVPENKLNLQGKNGCNTAVASSVPSCKKHPEQLWFRDWHKGRNETAKEAHIIFYGA